MKDLQLFINNQFCNSSSGATFETVNPATKELVAKVAEATADDVNRAVAAAQAAFESGVWSEIEPDERAGYLLRAAEILRRRADEFAEWECLDSGKPIRETKLIDIPYSARALEYFGNISREIKGEVIPVPGKQVFDFQTYEPHGVVAAITPWNFPLHLFTRSTCPALAAGNSVVAKTSPMTPMTSGLMGEIFSEAGFPPGVINIVHGGAEPGSALVSHPDVRMIAFTGSEAVGRRIMEASARSPIIKKMILELGGKGPLIAEPDCDLDGAVNSVLVGFCLAQGQVCCASSRLYLHNDIYDDFIKLILDRVEKIRIGDPMDPDTQFGAMMNPEQLERVDRYVKQATDDGAKLLIGGEKITEPPCDRGWFYRPTVLEVNDNKMTCVQEEIFGPVLSVLRYRDLDEALLMANDSPFGLGAAIWSNNPKTLFKAARKLDAGTVWMNTNIMSTMEAPFGGNKNSGMGREYGTMGIREYMKVKNQILHIAPEYPNFYGS